VEEKEVCLRESFQEMNPKRRPPLPRIRKRRNRSSPFPIKMLKRLHQNWRKNPRSKLPSRFARPNQRVKPPLRREAGREHKEGAM